MDYNIKVECILNRVQSVFHTFNLHVEKYDNDCMDCSLTCKELHANRKFLVTAFSQVFTEVMNVLAYKYPEMLDIKITSRLS